MKQYLIFVAVLSLFAACGKQSNDFNSLSRDGLIGNVMSVKTMCYYAKERFGEAEKLRMLDYYHSNYQLPLYPAYLSEYNEDGNQVKMTTYNENGIRQSLVKYEYEGNNQIALESYDSTGELNYSHKTEFENGLPVNYVSYKKHEGSTIDKDFEFEGTRIKSYNTYYDTVLISRTENSFYKNRLNESITRDTDGNVTNQQTNQWSESGQLLNLKLTSDGVEKLVISRAYSSEGYLKQYTSTGDWGEDANYTFKYTSFDKHGNWIERVIYSKEKVCYMEQRIIEYFE